MHSADRAPRVLFDISHPAHVHFFKHIIRLLEDKGWETTVVARQKDVTLRLLDSYGIPYTSSGRAGHRGVLGQFGELIARDLAIYGIARSFKPDVILTRNPCGVQVARLVGATGVFDTDDGREAGIHYMAAAPFAHVITTPACLPDLGPKQVRYPGYKQTAYLHPNHYTPNPEVLKLLGIKGGEPYYIVRFVAMDASHDKDQSGLTFGAKEAIVRTLQEHGRVIITSEGMLPAEWREMSFSIPPERIHDALAFASVYIGDSQTMAAEAAILGTPSLRCSSFAGHLAYLEELEHRYGLTAAFKPNEIQGLLAKLEEWLRRPGLKSEFAMRRRKFLADQCDVAQWMAEYLDELPSGKPCHPG